MSPLTHLDQAGNAHMVDVSDKDVTQRTATAHSCSGTDTPKCVAVVTAFSSGIPANNAPPSASWICHIRLVGHARPATVEAPQAMKNQLISACGRSASPTGSRRLAQK